MWGRALIGAAPPTRFPLTTDILAAQPDVPVVQDQERAPWAGDSVDSSIPFGLYNEDEVTPRKRRYGRRTMQKVAPGSL